MEYRSLAREVALLVLGQVSDKKIEDYQSFSLEKILDMGLDTLITHSREQLDDCALEIQNSIQPYNDSRPKDFKLQVRIGIHIGDIMYKENDIFGEIGD